MSNRTVDDLMNNSSIKDLLKDGDEVIQQLTTDFLDGNIGWDEYYDLVRQRLHETQNEENRANVDYDRAMKGI